MQERQTQTERRQRPPQQRDGEAAAAAFEETYLRLGPRLQKIAMKKFGIAFGDAEMLVQDVFTTYFMHADDVEKLEPYLIGAICNASRNYLRRAGAAKALFCGERPCAATPDDGLLKRLERKALLSRVLARIGARCRDLLERFYVHGEGTEAIAEDLDLTRGTVLVNLYKCRQRALEAYRSLMRRS